MSSQIAAMTTMHNHLNGNYLSKVTHYSLLSLSKAWHGETIVWCCQVVDLSKPWSPVYESHPPVSPSVECQLICLFSSSAGSSFSALWRSGSKQRYVCLPGTKPWTEYACHNNTMKASGRISTQILQLSKSTKKTRSLKQTDFFLMCQKTETLQTLA